MTSAESSETPEPLVDYEVTPIPDAPGVVATIALNRPHELNAMSWEMITAFDAAVSRAAEDEDVRVVFVTGRGRAFSAGGDLKKYIELQHDAVRFPQFVAELHAAFGRLRSLRVPVIALVNGVTAAGGLELLLNCDLAIAAASARSCVTVTSVTPLSRASARMSRRKAERVSVSSAENGSSSSSTEGALASARASATRCCWPPERLTGSALARSLSPIFSISAATLA